MSESRLIPPLASARIQRWALTLGAYDYTIEYKPGEIHTNTDSLSQLPLPDYPSNVPSPLKIILMMELVQSSLVTAKYICQWTDGDPILA